MVKISALIFRCMRTIYNLRLLKRKPYPIGYNPRIAAVVLARIYRGDKPELTTLELEQWIRYIQYAGADIVYLYDMNENKNESLASWVSGLFDPGEVVYHDWQKYTPFTIEGTQQTAYQHAIDQYSKDCEWHLAVDMDEYPFVLDDLDPGFLKRLITRINKELPDCTEISFPNFIFSGMPKEKLWLFERMQRRFPSRANHLDKPLYIASRVRAQLHHNFLKSGKSIDVPSEIARINHYWGARAQDWKPDTPETLSKTIPDNSILPILQKLQKIPIQSHTLPAYVKNRYWLESEAVELFRHISRR